MFADSNIQLFVGGGAGRGSVGGGGGPICRLRYSCSLADSRQGNPYTKPSILSIKRQSRVNTITGGHGKY